MILTFLGVLSLDNIQFLLDISEGALKLVSSLLTGLVHAMAHFFNFVIFKLELPLQMRNLNMKQLLGKGRFI